MEFLELYTGSAFVNVARANVIEIRISYGLQMRNNLSLNLSFNGTGRGN